MESLQGGADEVSDGTVLRVAQSSMELFLHEKLRASVVVRLHTLLRKTATTNHLASLFAEWSSFIHTVSHILKTITVEEVQRMHPVQPV